MHMRASQISWGHACSLAVVLVQSLSPVRLFATPWTAAPQASLSFTISQTLLRLMSIEWMIPSNHLILVPFSSCPQSFPASGSFPINQLFASGGQSIGALVSASVLPMNIQGSFLLGWTGWISLLSKGLSRDFSNTTFKGINSLALSLLYGPTLTSAHDYRKNHSFDCMDLCRQSDVSCCLFFLHLSS